jgi:tetratricopeptide (TPR) repeat protein
LESKMTWEENQTNGETAYSQGQYAESARYFAIAIGVAEADADDNEKLADSLYFLGKVFTHLEDYPKAESALTKALAIRGKAGGTENADVARIIEQLGTLYLNERKYAQSESMLRRALDMRRKLFGEDSTQAAESLAVLGGLHISQNLLADGEFLLKQSLNLQEKLLGQEDIGLAPTLGLLALCKMRLKDYSRAQEYSRRALAIREHTLGNDHPDIAMTLHIMASTCMAQGDFKKASGHYERTLAIRERYLPPTHSGVISVLKALGYCYLRQHEFQKAELTFQKLESVAFNINVHTKEWCDAVRNLAHLYVVERRFEEGEHYIYRVLDQYDSAKIDNEACKQSLEASLVRCYVGQKKYIDLARELPNITSTVLSKARKKLEASPSVTNFKGVLASIGRKAPVSDVDVNH